MKLIAFNLDRCEVCIADGHALGVLSIIDFRSNSQPATRLGIGNQVQPRLAWMRRDAHGARSFDDGIDNS